MEVGMGDERPIRFQSAAEPRGTEEQELAFLNHVMQALTSTLDLDEVLTLVLEELRHLLEVTASSIWLIEPDTGDLVCLQATGPRHATVRGWRVPSGTGLIGWVVERDESLIVADAQHDTRHYSDLDRQTGLVVRSIIGVPLRSRLGVIGVIEPSTSTPTVSSKIFCIWSSCWLPPLPSPLKTPDCFRRRGGEPIGWLCSRRSPRRLISRWNWTPWFRPLCAN
jgi:transcriptional regulator with GAF, ATPase, and Fis domain